MKNFVVMLIFQVKDHDTKEVFYDPKTAIFSLGDDVSAKGAKIALDTFLSAKTLESLESLEDWPLTKPGRIRVTLASVSFLPNIFG